MTRKVVFVALLLLAGCSTHKQAQTALEMQADPWVLHPKFGANDSAWLSNGSVGFVLGHKPAVFHWESYESTGEEKIVPYADKLLPELEVTSQNMLTGVVTTKDGESWVLPRAEDALISDRNRVISTSKAGVRLIQGDTQNRFMRASQENSRLWQTDIEIDGPIEDQIAVRSFLYYLRGGVAKRPSPFGLSSTLYSGHVFWDADIWMFPALALLDPDRAKYVSDYRLRLVSQAESNAAQWLADGRQTASGSVQSTYDSGRPFAIVKFPWESGVTGKETVPGSSRFEEHITGSVLFGLCQAQALGFLDSSAISKLRAMAANYYRLRSEASKSLREIHGVMSPDEFHVGDNDLYTNLLAEWLMNGCSWNDKPSFKLPRDATTFLTYDNDLLKAYKQASAVLAIYPLQYPPAEREARAMMERFGSKVIKNGPAMSDSIHSIIWARMGDSERAYGAWLASWRPFTNHSFLLFSEKRNQERTYFLTGAAGSLQSVLYGFIGFRIDSRKEPGAMWAKQLNGGFWLSAKPHLPRAWKRVTLKNFYVLGKKYNLTATHSNLTVTLGDQ